MGKFCKWGDLGEESAQSPENSEDKINTVL